LSENFRDSLPFLLTREGEMFLKRGEAPLFIIRDYAKISELRSLSEEPKK